MRCRDLAEISEVPEALIRDAFRLQRVGLSVVGPDTRWIEVNEHACEIIGYHRHELLGRSWEDLTHPDDLTTSRSLFARALAGEFDHYSIEKRFIRKDGETVLVDLSSRSVRDRQGKLEYFVTVYQDVTDRRSAERALRDSEQRFRDFATAAADWFWETDQSLRYTYVSERQEAALGTPRASAIGQTRQELFSDVDYSSEAERKLDERIASQQPFTDHEIIRRFADGEHQVIRISGKPYHDEGGAFLGYRGVGRDVTESYRLTQQLAHEASHDPLTGLVNRRDFENRLGRVLNTASADSSVHGLCWLDLDRFKVINDACGHLAGDEMLRQLADMLRMKVRKRDTLARVGGDEFAVLMEHCSISQARRVANSMRNAVRQFRFGWEGRIYRVGVSIGLVSISGVSRSVNDVLRNADAACLAAKEHGRDRVHVISAEDPDLSLRHRDTQWVMNRGACPRRGSPGDPVAAAR